jgi:hypothetical protein
MALAQERASLDGREGVWLLRALRAKVHRHLGHGSFAEYVERLFGYNYRTTEDKLRTAEALESLPVMTRALNDGQIHWSAARELSRVAIAETEREWLLAARGCTVRQIEKLGSGRVPGDRPTDPADPTLERHVLRFEVTAETMATFREAVKRLRKESDERLDDDAVLLLMAREVLAGKRDEGHASYQVAVNVCEHCRQGTQAANGEDVRVDPAVVETAECDAQLLPTHVGERATQTIRPARRRAVMRRDGGRCVVPGCRHATFVDVHHVRPRCEGGGDEVENLVVLCAAHHRAVHRGALKVERSAGGHLAVRRSDIEPC